MKLLDNRFCRGLLFLLLMIGFTGVASAQRSVSGVVTDAESGDPLIGASVLVTGTSTGTITDFDGNFSINVPANAETLTFSYTGFGSQEITIGEQSVINVELSSGETLEEVVVIGYGSVKQEEVTSAVTTVDAKDFNVGNINDPTQLVQGKVAGLQISKAGGNPNENTTLRLRGVSSFGGNQGPLIIIDGVVGADLQTVDPSDIESINVLKDGSAAAIYGIQASSGVVIVTTKRGAAGKGQLEYRGYVSAENLAAGPEVASADEYLELLAEASPGLETNNLYNSGADTDWVDEVTRTALSHVHNLSYSGGIGSTTYRASANYRDIQGIGVVNDGFRQINGRLSITQKAFNDRLTLQADVTATDRDADEFNTQAFRFATIYNPTAPVFVTDEGADLQEGIFNTGVSNYGGYHETIFDDTFNPVAIANQTRSERQTNTSLYSFRAGYDVLDNLKLQMNYSRQRKQQLFGFFADRESRQAGNGQADLFSPVKGSATRENIDDRNDLFEVTGTYDIDLGSNSLELLAGYSWQRFQSQGFRFSGRGFPSNATSFNDISAALDNVNGQSSITSFKGESLVIGFFGRARFNFGGAYNVTASVRRDGSSRNGPENRWDIFPAISASADLVKALDLSGGVNSLKLRAGYGITGALPNGNYNFLQRFGANGNFPYEGQQITALGALNNSNPNLRFERKGEFNVGLDFAFVDYKLTGSLDYYIRSVSDLILRDVPVSTPTNIFATTEANVDNLNLTSSGIELALSYDLGTPGSNFSYTPSITFATYNTEVEDNGETGPFVFNDGFLLTSSAPGSPGQNDDPIAQIRFGEEFGGIYTRVFDEEASLAAGAFRFVDQDGDAGDDVNNPRSDPDDRVLVGNGLPDFSIGFQNQFRFGAVDFSFFLRGDFGHDLANMNNNFYGLQANLSARPVDNVVVSDEFVDLSINDQAIFSSLYVEDASFLVLDNAQIGVNIPLKEGSPFRSIRPYFAGQNLFYITGYSGFDPNVRYNDRGSDPLAGENPLVQGIDRRYTYWRTRTFTFGVTVGL